MSIERFIYTDGPDKGRIKDLEVARDLAETEDTWRDEHDGKPMLAPPTRLGESETHYRDMVNDELDRLIRVKMLKELDELAAIYSDPALREADPESSDEAWLSYGIANRLASLGEEHGFDLQTCEEIMAMPFEEAFETAYSNLVSAGLDADEILAEFMEEPQE